MKNVSVFFLIALAALQIPFTQIMGASVRFTAFDFIVPVYGAFLGTFPGITTALLAQLTSLLFHGGITDVSQVLRLIPSMFAIWYFSSSKGSNIFVAFFAIIAFNLHPIGRSAWQYSLFWLIPMVSQIYHKNLFLRAMGATFTAHAVGGALWVWMYGLSQSLWLSLIPQVVLERMVMAQGIVITYLAYTYLTNALRQKTFFPTHAWRYSHA